MAARALPPLRTVIVVVGLMILTGGTYTNAGAQPPVGAFTPGSYWNTPIDAKGAAPVDPNSATYVQNALNNSPGYLELSTSPAYRSPVYYASPTDKLYTVTASAYGSPVTIRLPDGARPNSGTDAEMTVYDYGDNLVAGFWHLTYRSATDTYHAVGVDRWHLDSNGLAATGSDDPYNGGHRGIPASSRAVEMRDLANGVIARRLECFWWATGVMPGQPPGTAYWPMTGAERKHQGVVPEGIVARIKPSVDLATLNLTPDALIIATSLQEYGCIVGDNAGGRHSRLKLAGDVTPPDLNPDSLQAIPFRNWEFVKGGYDPSG
ncbi:MAG: hypothetical protein M3P18_06540 [Actinomycetota bacterium]|nr:hypothetical protein [Actinomycetota bacterium]